MKALLAEAKEVFDFVKTDRIDSMRIEALHRQDLTCSPTAVNRVDTHMNLIHDYVGGARKQSEFLSYLSQCPEFTKYYNERKPVAKAKIDGIFERCNHQRWQRMDFFTKALTVHFKRLHKLCCMDKVPLSAYILLCQAMRNHINKGLNSEHGRFDCLLGDGYMAQVANMIRGRFNMDGTDPSGQKVGLVDKHQIWAFYVDPFNHHWRSTFRVEGSFAMHVKEMIEFFIPKDEDDSTETRKKVKNDFLVR